MKVLVPIDGSAYSQAAISEAAELVGAIGGAVTLLTVSTVIRLEAFTPLATVEFTPGQIARDMVYETPSQAEAMTYLEEAAKAFRARGIAPTLLHKIGDPAETIIEVAEEWRPEIVVMGSHGRTGIKRFLLGSVSEKVTRHAPCSVLITRGEPFVLR